LRLWTFLLRIQPSEFARARAAFASSQVKKTSTLEKLPFWLSVSPDGNSVLYEHLDQQDSHIKLLKNFQ
jgi:hypothetical protein